MLRTRLRHASSETRITRYPRHLFFHASLNSSRYCESFWDETTKNKTRDIRYSYLCEPKFGNTSCTTAVSGL